MYVNDMTIDYGAEGRKAIKLLLSEANKKGLIPKIGKLTFV